MTFVDGNTYKAKVIGKDPSGDIAVLQVTDNFSPEKLVPLAVVNSSSLQVGQQMSKRHSIIKMSNKLMVGVAIVQLAETLKVRENANYNWLESQRSACSFLRC